MPHSNLPYLILWHQFPTVIFTVKILDDQAGLEDHQSVIHQRWHDRIRVQNHIVGRKLVTHLQVKQTTFIGNLNLCESQADLL